MTRLYIDLVKGTLEVEGEEEFVDKIYKDFKTELADFQNEPRSSKDTKEGISDEKPKLATVRRKQSLTKSRPRASKENYIPVKNLNLTGNGQDKSLKDFYKDKGPKTFYDKNVVFVYYLKKIAKVEKVTLEHIFTCYVDVGSSKPNAFKQSIADTSSRKGWLDTSSFENIDISIRGENRVEQELPEKGGKES